MIKEMYIHKHYRSLQSVVKLSDSLLVDFIVVLPIRIITFFVLNLVYDLFVRPLFQHFRSDIFAVFIVV